MDKNLDFSKLFKDVREIPSSNDRFRVEVVGFSSTFSRILSLLSFVQTALGLPQRGRLLTAP